MDCHSLLEKSKLPAVIFIHEEAERKDLKDSGQSLFIGKLIAASEMIGVSFNHRTLTGKSTLTEAYSDSIDLINYIRENAEKYNVDKDRIAIWAASGGVPYGISAGLMDNPDYIKALAAVYTSVKNEDSSFQVISVSSKGLSFLVLILMLYPSASGSILSSRTPIDILLPSINNGEPPKKLKVI